MKEVRSHEGSLYIEGQNNRVADVRRVFNPHQPIADQNLFSGRETQLNQAVTALRTPGKHPIVFGARGVGKTSLANIIKLIAPIDGFVTASTQCNSSSTFLTIVKSLLSAIRHEKISEIAGFTSRAEGERVSLASYLGDSFSQEDVVNLIKQFGTKVLLIIDEFDRVRSSERTRMSDLIKTASDIGGTAIKLLIVGVGETLDDLIKDHPSIERNISEVQMVLMSADEIREIIRKGSVELRVSFDDDVVEKIVECAQGVPYFAHLLAQHATVNAIHGEKDVISMLNFIAGIGQALEDVDHSIKKSYRDAVHSNRPSQFANVLFAAAMADADEFGYFTAKDLTEVAAKSDGTCFSLQGVQYPLSKLSAPERGEIIRKEGQEKRYQYKFSNPMMKQYIIMKRIADAR